jgi:hypothetical protein
MTTRYRESHYEDVARILANTFDDHSRSCPDFHEGEDVILDDLAERFVTLFAADNPESVYCGYCGDDKGTTSICTRPNEKHNFEGGFNRDKFLAACGIES